MIGALTRRPFGSFLTGRRITEVDISACVHYCGFRYGGGTYHPYESYIRDLIGGASVQRARSRLVDFLRHYRPHHFAEALGCELSREYPLWSHPWKRRLPRPAWLDRPEDCPDILTHFSPKGILSSRIDEECGWLERALKRMREEGYRPDKFRHVVGVELEPADGPSTFLLTDGNHRVAALSALGEVRVKLQHPMLEPVAREKDVASWPQVRAGRYTADDSLRVFAAYRLGNHRYRTTELPARVITSATSAAVAYE